MDAPTPAQRRLLEMIQRLAPVRAEELAAATDTTAVAVRQHLQQLEARGLVQKRTAPPQGRGRPATEWDLCAAGREFLPDAHAELTLGLLQAIDSALGAKGRDAVLAARGAQQLAAYREELSRQRSLAARVRRLARIRSREGYMAEARKVGGREWLLIEHHCPVCEAARSCQGICRVELEVFQKVLGDDVHVARTEHLLDDGRRCVYRIRKRSS